MDQGGRKVSDDTAKQKKNPRKIKGVFMSKDRVRTFKIRGHLRLQHVISVVQ